MNAAPIPPQRRQTPAGSPKSLAPAQPADDAPDIVTIRIVETNDMHGTVVPTLDNRIYDRPALMGGFAYLATLVHKVRALDPQHFLLLDAGDSVHGQAATDLEQGLPMADLMNKLGYNATTVGNHDVQWGLAALEARAQRNQFPTITANVAHSDGTPLVNSVPYRVFDMGDVKIGVTGVLTRETISSQRADRLEGIHIGDESKALDASIKAMREQGVDIIRPLTHVGMEEDVKLASEHPGEGLLFQGGHSHTRVGAPVEVAGNTITQNGYMLREAGLTEIDYDRKHRRVVEVRHTLIPLDAEAIPPDPEVAAMVDKLRAAAEARLGQEVTSMPAALTRSSRESSSLGNVVTDAMRRAAGTDVALMNSDGLRSDLPAGKVCLRHLYEVFPFGGGLMKGHISGRDLLAALEHSVALRSSDPNVRSGFLQVSGLTFHYNDRLPPGYRVTQVEVGGKPLELRRNYSIALEDFLSGGDKLGYDMFGRQPFTSTSEAIMDVLAEQLQQGAWQPGHDEKRIVDDTPLSERQRG
jgi:2',3'-cyclic-nucleotide 2'-phosphodiesterase (5'-nucleotidase family)